MLSLILGLQEHVENGSKKMAMAGQRLEIMSLLSSLVEELSSNFSVLFVSGKSQPFVNDGGMLLGLLQFRDVLTIFGLNTQFFFFMKTFVITNWDYRSKYSFQQ